MKWKAIKMFAQKVIKPKHVKKIICDEVCDMVKEWKRDNFAPSTKELDGLIGSDWIDKYDELFYETAQHEGAEAIWYIKEFFAAHEIDIFEYLKLLEQKRIYDSEKHTVSEKKTTKIITY